MERKDGYYFGTEIEGKWYRRYMAKGMLARGTGKYWFDETALSFLRMLTAKPIRIPYASIYDIKTGKWHSGRWGQGYNVIKVLWTENDRKLSSGFILSKNNPEVSEIVNYLKKKITV
ncbi:MAG: putative integron cassette protein [Herbinix sp.]|nr:putative integron cassette protein [Herbinix sp.]